MVWAPWLAEPALLVELVANDDLPDQLARKGNEHRADQQGSTGDQRAGALPAAQQFILGAADRDQERLQHQPELRLVIRRFHFERTAM